jgi:C-terminal processing protease CtpA/Prc
VKRRACLRAESGILGPARQALGLALLALLLGACAPLPTRPTTGPLLDVAPDIPHASTQALSSVYAREQSRVDAAQRVWEVVGERFYDPKMNGIDWSAVRAQYMPRVAAAKSDAQFYRELKQMLAELGDSHTEVLTPREALDLRRFVALRTGLVLGVIDGKIAVIEVDPDTPAAQSGVRPGDVVTAMNGTRLDAAFVRAALADASTARHLPGAGDGPESLPADARDAERIRVLRATRRLLRTQIGANPLPGTPIEFELQREAEVFKVALRTQPQARPPQVQFRWIEAPGGGGGGVALIRFTRFQPSVRDELERALDSAAGARAVVIDMRGNGGGLLDTYRWFSGQFLPDERVPMRATRRDGSGSNAQKVSDLRVGPSTYRRPPLLMPVAVLIDGRTGSAAELLAVTLAEQRNALLVGEPTCGCVVGVRVEYVLPDGGGLRIAETGFVSARGARMEGQPTLPTVRVTPTLADLRAGRDPVLDEAVRRLVPRTALRAPAPAAPMSVELRAVLP